jgi:hypothetical protein
MADSCILIYNSSQFETLVLILTQLPYIAYALSRTLSTIAIIEQFINFEKSIYF